MNVSMYHNPKCSKCRATLALLQEKGIAPELITYLETSPTVAALAEVVKKLGKGPKAIIRFNEDLAKELGISQTDERPDAEWLQIIADNPKLLERPIVINGDRAAIGRPPEQVLGIL
ncbi:MAG: arsenate reductase (glutaredoxin) [Sideroxydans sp.]|nr:arsenate reductase (glutaredoxin) [Sideroxydans sp.]